MIKKIKALKFFDQVKNEAKKVSWPDKKDLITSSSIVIIAVLIFSLLTMFLDYTIHSFIVFLLNFGK
ncbi:MAG TPA: preprotein translocase subunit SecE [Candidatus Megaira endosymbiont of Nemacystus decipiens]|nr:preprotein translocase subunit SecE [Candidatus Megaera endosymbiont of Nemacystus decipiens]